MDTDTTKIIRLNIEEARRMYEAGLNPDFVKMLGEEFWEELDKSEPQKEVIRKSKSAVVRTIRTLP